MKPVEKTVIHNVALASNLDYAQPLDRLEKPVAMISKLNYMKPKDSPAESGIFHEADKVVFKK